MIDAIIVHLSSDNGLIELLILFLIEWNMCIGHWICLTVSWISCPNCYIIFLLNNCLRTIGLKMLTRDGTEILNAINNPPPPPTTPPNSDQFSIKRKVFYAGDILIRSELIIWAPVLLIIMQQSQWIDFCM